jgi:hypothetical protein
MYLIFNSVKMATSIMDLTKTDMTGLAMKDMTGLARTDKTHDGFRSVENT